jgi:(S)-ureidoglycine aminohydrolase
MGYLNNQTGYRDSLLSTRSIVKKNNYVVLEPDGLVKNVVPGYENCDTTILGCPEIGATFADYLVTAHADGKNLQGIGGEGIESFLFVIEGEVNVRNADQDAVLSAGGYMFSPEDKPMCFENKSGAEAKLYIYRRRYLPLEGRTAHTVVGNINDLDYMDYEGMTNCQSKDLLPAAQDLGFDMNMHILKFEPGASHGYLETHVQQHGMYFLQGKGMYNLDNDWMPLEKGDYVFMDSYCPQACYAVGREDYVYIYSKDCNRDIQL